MQPRVDGGEVTQTPTVGPEPHEDVLGAMSYDELARP
jgi:hypothetical protein